MFAGGIVNVYVKLGYSVDPPEGKSGQLAYTSIDSANLHDFNFQHLMIL
jgi:hypothetical protein